jgi:hypothetical protein
MRIGFSLGRCVRDIVQGEVSIDEVAFVITATNILERDQLDHIISVYCSERRYLLDCDYDRSLEIAQILWDTNRLIQPRRQGMHRHMQPENAIWVDIFPTVLSDNESVKRAWDNYRFMIHMVENVDTEATEVFKV